MAGIKWHSWFLAHTSPDLVPLETYPSPPEVHHQLLCVLILKRNSIRSKIRHTCFPSNKGIISTSRNVSDRTCISARKPNANDWQHCWMFWFSGRSVTCLKILLHQNCFVRTSFAKRLLLQFAIWQDYNSSPAQTLSHPILSRGVMKKGISPSLSD